MPNPFPAIEAHPIEGLRAASAIPEALAQKLAAEHYGPPTTAHRLDSERDQNFRLTTPTCSSRAWIRHYGPRIKPCPIDWKCEASKQKLTLSTIK